MDMYDSLGGASAVKGESGYFPNVYVSVGEMMSGGNARDVAIRTAGIDIAGSVTNIPSVVLILFSPFLLSILCLIYLGYSYYKKRKNYDIIVFILPWFVMFLLASVIAVRATIFLAPVYAILSAIMLARLWDFVLTKKESVGAVNHV